MADPRVLELDLVRLSDGTRPIRVFTLLDPFVADEGMASRLAAAHARMIAAYRNREWAEAEAALRECRSFRIEALGTLYSLYRTRILTAREIAPPSGWDGATIGTLEEIDAVTEVTPGGPPPRHSGERDEGARGC
jgi:adenylate cyclase